MKIKFEVIKEWQEHFMTLNHFDSKVVPDGYTHDNLEELIEILDKLLYFMHMTNREEI